MASRHSPRWATLMPNSTCDLASFRASANDGAADTVAMQATRSTTRTFIGGCPSLYRTGRQTGARHMPWLNKKNAIFTGDRRVLDLRNVVVVSSPRRHRRPGQL